MKKRVLVDLTYLKNPYCGLGQVAINFGREISKIVDSEIEWTFLTTKKEQVEQFGNGSFLQKSVNPLTKHSLLPIDKGFDLFHIAHQNPPYRASNGKKNILTIHDLNFLGKNRHKKRRNILGKFKLMSIGHPSSLAFQNLRLPKS